ncbi:hypothetical protein G6F56_007362 [Rhizopus delemar]|nr:hypothetical protein G6F56_007362 [Rhizopus delemar]
MTDIDIQKTKELLYRSLTKNPLSISYEFQEFIDFKNTKSKVTPFDITVYEPEKQRDDKRYTVEELMTYGTKLIDASLYQHIRNNEWFGFEPIRNTAQADNPSEIGEALFCVLHCLLTRDRIEYDSEKVEKDPYFISDIFKCPESFDIYSKMIASFDINLMNKSWLKHIELYGIPLKIKHRLTFGVLGHEVLDIFRIYEPENLQNSDCQDAYYSALRFASKGPSWDIFPMTSTPEKLKKFKELELVLKMMIYKIYTITQIQEMKACGFLVNDDLVSHSLPLKISDYDYNNFKNFIFTEKILAKPANNVLVSKFTYPLYFCGSLEEQSTKGKLSNQTKSFIAFNY